MRKIAVPAVSSLLSLVAGCAARPDTSGTRVVEEHGYPGCIELSNGRTRVVLEPNCGGRVLIYSLDGTNVIYIDSAHDGLVTPAPGVRLFPCAGRFDIGPETTIPKRPVLWREKWEAEITGPRAARMISRKDPATGVQLTREFVLDAESSHLRCTQIITNVSDRTRRYCHWSRTFAVGGGICLVPLNPESRYPAGYLIYGPGGKLDFRPAPEPNIRVRDGILEIIGAPSRPKFAIDTFEEWIAYVTQENQLFVKCFPAYPDRVYGEIAGNTVSIWYKDDLVCEVEPIGPWETIEAGKSVSFTEDWWLLEYPYPEDRTIDLAQLRKLVEGLD
jgi:hypothetical protein